MCGGSEDRAGFGCVSVASYPAELRPGTKFRDGSVCRTDEHIGVLTSRLGELWTGCRPYCCHSGNLPRRKQAIGVAFDGTNIRVTNSGDNSAAKLLASSGATAAPTRRDRTPRR